MEINSNEYKQLIEDLYSQIETYKAEHESLKGELSILINENKNLSKNYSELINSQIENGFESDQVNNLKNQIEFLVQEKQSSYELWQNSMKIVDQLEDELLMFRGGPQDFISKKEIQILKEQHSKEIEELQNKTQIFIKELESTKKHHVHSLDHKTEELSLVLRSNKEAHNQIKELQVEIGVLKETIIGLEKKLEEKEYIIKERDKQIEKLHQMEVESKIRVAEALNIVDTVIFEKNQAIAKENESKEQIMQLTKTINDIIKEAGEKVDVEVGHVKDQYNTKIKEIYKEIKSLKDDLHDKSLELETENKKRKNLEEELGRIKFGSSITEDEKSIKILHLERNLESTFQKLVLSERKIVQLTTERESLKMDLDQMSNHFGEANKDFENQRKEFLLEIKKLKHELNNARILLEKYENDIKNLTVKYEITEQELTEKINYQNRELKMLQENILKIENKCHQEKNELKKYLKSERDLNKKWQREVKDITNKLQNRIKELKSENMELKKHLQNDVS